jgi:hypothetical protein
MTRDETARQGRTEPVRDEGGRRCQVGTDSNSTTAHCGYNASNYVSGEAAFGRAVALASSINRKLDRALG